MDEALIQVGLPVKCRKCRKEGRVKPLFVDPDHGGWYKSKLLRSTPNRWFCPEHYEIGREMDNHFYENYKTPDPYPEQKQVEATVDELYELIG